MQLLGLLQLALLLLVGSLNRTLQALARTMSRRGLGYVVTLTLIVTLLGAAGLYAFERELPDGQALPDFATALWWTGTIMTTMGTDYWPRTGAGRSLCLLLGLHAFAMFGYVTAALASFFIGTDAGATPPRSPDRQPSRHCGSRLPACARTCRGFGSNVSGSSPDAPAGGDLRSLSNIRTCTVAMLYF